MSDKLYTTTQAAEILGVTPGRVRQLVADGRIKVTRIGRDNFITEEELEKKKKQRAPRSKSNEK